MTYASRDEVLQHLNLTETSNEDLVGRIDAALAASTVEIDNDTGRSFSQADEPSARVFFGDVDDPRCLRLPDVVSISAIRVDDDDDGQFETTIEASGYELDRAVDRPPSWPFDRVRLLDRSFPTGGRRRRRIEVTAAWGWTAVPPTIQQACSLLAARLAQRPSTALFGVQSFGDVGTQSIRKDDDYWRLIRPYCRLEVIV